MKIVDGVITKMPDDIPCGYLATHRANTMNTINTIAVDKKLIKKTLRKMIENVGKSYIYILGEADVTLLYTQALHKHIKKMAKFRRGMFT